MNWLKEDYDDIIFKLGLFIFNPVVSFIYACRRINTKSSYFIFTLFSLVLCLSITTPEVRDDDFNFDSITYRFDFENYVGEPISYFKNNFDEYISLSGKSDFYADVVYFFVSRFTDNYHLMFLTIGCVFCLFQLKSLRILTKNKYFKNSISTLLIVGIFTINQIFNVNAFRFYTALWIATYAILSFFLEGEKKSLLLILITPFFHGSFFVLVIYFLISLFIQRFYRVVKYFYLSSFILSSVSVVIFTNSLDFLPDSLYLKYYAYVSDSYMSYINDSGSGAIWVRRLLESLSSISINFIALYFMYLKRKDYINPGSERLFRFLLMMTSFVNMTLIIPSLGSRFMILLMPIIAYLLLDNINSSKYSRKVVYLFASILVLFFISPFNIYQFPCLSYYFQLIHNSFFYSSPLYSIYINIL